MSEILQQSHKSQAENQNHSGAGEASGRASEQREAAYKIVPWTGERYQGKEEKEKAPSRGGVGEGVHNPGRLSAQALSEASGADVAVPGCGPPDLHVTACISDIFIQKDFEQLDEYVRIFPGVAYFRNRSRAMNGKNNGGGKKGKVVSFSDRSRRAMITTLARLDEPMELWFDLTFADDVMQGKTIEERAKFAARCKWEWEQKTNRMGYRWRGIWKKEWKKRRSGILKGELVPHYHVCVTWPGLSEADYHKAWERAGVAWVEATGTEQINKSLLVTLHAESMRFVKSRKKAQQYMSKYIGKGENQEGDESIGRCWGRVGDPQEAEGRQVELQHGEVVALKRCLRKYAKRVRKGRFMESLRRSHAKFFFLAPSEVIEKMIAYSLNTGPVLDGVPF